MGVRLFIGNLPYGATEADLRAHFAPVAPPSHIAMPVDRETGRPRGFAFVEFAERGQAEEVVRKFDAQPFQGRTLAVSEARAREDRPAPRPPGAGGFPPRPSFGGPRPSGGGGFGGPPPPPGSRDRSANFGPPAPPKRLRGSKKGQQQEYKPRGPIKERSGGRIYAVDDLDDGDAAEIESLAAPDADVDVAAAPDEEGQDDQD